MNSDMREEKKVASGQLSVVRKKPEDYFFRASAEDFKKIPGSPIAYNLGCATYDAYEKYTKINKFGETGSGLQTSDNNRFLRQWYEIGYLDIEFKATNEYSAKSSACKWFPHKKGGPFRKWYGNNDYVLNWKNGGAELYEFARSLYGSPTRIIKNTHRYYQRAITWSHTTSSRFSARILEEGFIFNVEAPSLFDTDEVLFLPYLCSSVGTRFIELANPTLHFVSNSVGELPFFYEGIEKYRGMIQPIFDKVMFFSKIDWDFYETSWEFTTLPLLQHNSSQSTLKISSQNLRTHWQEITLEMQRLEEENNRIFIEAYGLQDELTPEVPLKEITLTCNPHYRYKLSGQWLKTSPQEQEAELERRLRQDTIKEFLSYAVGCMFGRYSLDKPGLILANQGETLADFVRKVSSDQWPVTSRKDDNLAISSLPSNSGENHECESLQGSNRMAESHEPGGIGISGDQTISKGGTVRVNESNKASSGIDSVKHSGGASPAIDSGVQEFSINSTGLVGRSGNPTVDRHAAQLYNSGTTGTYHGNPTGSQQDAPISDEQTNHWPLDTSHLSFTPDADNVIPILDQDWFIDDITSRFSEFLKTTFGTEHYVENLKFITTAIGKDIRKYFLKDFYKDHLKTYKKRPIYWLFSSPKGSFNALIYMHRYRPDTASVILNDYLREFRTKLIARREHLEQVSISASASKQEKTKALKEIEKLKKTITELDEYENETLYPLATQNIEIDLDDGVKVNYKKFGKALKKVPGLS